MQRIYTESVDPSTEPITMNYTTWVSQIEKKNNQISK